MRHLRSVWIATFLVVLASLAEIGVGPTPLAGQTTRKAVPPACRPTVATNRRIVQNFYALALGSLKPREGFEKYMAPEFVEHKADVPEGTREATIRYLEALIQEVPAPRWELLRTIAEGDLVVLHARFTPADGAPAYAIADIFRLKNCAIVEHWDVVASPPKDQLNPNPRF